MKLEMQIKVMALLDGELTPAEAREIELLLGSDPEARQWRESLLRVRESLRGNEAEVKCPETREFYWSRIERDIARSAPAVAGPEQLPWLTVLRRYLMPVSGFALVMLLALGSLKMWVGEGRYEPSIIENVSEYTESVSFRNPSEKMFVVWIVNRDLAGVEDLETEEETVVD